MTSFAKYFSEAILVRISLISVFSVLMCNDFLLWSVVETRLILQEGLLELLLELGWYLVKVGVLRTWSSPINFNCPSAVLGKCPQLGRDHLLRVELYVVEFWRVYFLSTCSRSATIRVPFQTSLPAYQTYSRRDLGNTVHPNRWIFNRSKNRNGVIIIPTNQIKFFDSTDSLKRLRYFPHIVAIHHGIHPPSSGQLQQSRKGSFLHSAYRYSAISNIFFERWGVDLDEPIIPWSTSKIIAKFQEMINESKWLFGFLVGSKKFCFITDPSAAKLCPTIAYRWLFPDSQVSMKTLCSAVINSLQFCCSRYGFTCASLA